MATKKKTDEEVKEVKKEKKQETENKVSDLSLEEIKAIEITREYFLMFEVVRPHDSSGRYFSQDRQELYNYLATNSKKYKLINSLRWAVKDYDYARGELISIENYFEEKRKKLFELIGEPKLY